MNLSRRHLFTGALAFLLAPPDLLPHRKGWVLGGLPGRSSGWIENPPTYDTWLLTWQVTILGETQGYHWVVRQPHGTPPPETSWWLRGRQAAAGETVEIADGETAQIVVKTQTRVR